jgi:hypothetical protein
MQRKIIVLLFISLTALYAQKEKVITLSKVFPDSNSKVADDYLSFPTTMNTFRNEYYINDLTNNCIKVYDRTGKYIRKIGKKGNGPGEINESFRFTINPKNGDIYISDQGDSKITVLSNKGKYIASIKTIGSPWGMYYYNDKLYTLMYDRDKGFKIAAYKDYKIIDEYGELINKKILANKKNIRNLYSIPRLRFFKDKLCVYSQRSPEINILNTDDRSVNRSILLKNGRYNENYENNLNPRRENNVIYTKNVFADLVIDNNLIYVLEEGGPKILIYDYNGNIQSEIQIKNMKGKLYQFIRYENNEYQFINLDTSTIEIYK